MQRRASLLLLLLAVGVVCVLLWETVLGPALLGDGGDAERDALGTALLEQEGGAAADPSGPGLAPTGHRPLEAGAAGAAGARAGDEAAAGAALGSGASDVLAPFHGTVVDARSQPAAGVKITMVPVGGSAPEAPFTTGDDGTFDHPAHPGRYALLFDGGADGGLVLRSWMLDGAARDDLTFTLREPAQVEVHVLRGGQGVPQVAVTIASKAVADLLAQQGVTGADGTATFEGLVPGRYELDAQVPDGPLVHHEFGVPAAKTVPVRVRVPEGVTLKGVVRAGKDGPGVARAHLTLESVVRGSSGVFETAFDTNADGSFEAVVPRGYARDLTVEADGYATWPPPRQKRGVLRSLRGLARAGPVVRDIVLESGAQLTGRVHLEDDTPAPGVGLRFVMRKGPTLQATSQADGTYHLANLVPGGYVVEVSTPGWFPAQGQALKVGVPGGSPTEPQSFDVAVVGSWRLQGVVVDEAGVGVGGARVWVMGGGRALRGARDAGRTLEVFTHADGTWAIGDIPPDQGVVARAAMGELQADPVSVSGSGPSGTPVKLVLRGTGSLRGQVVDMATRMPVAGARVRLVPDPWDGRGGRTLRSDARGNFHVAHLIPGAWKLTPSRSGYLASPTESVSVPRGGEAQVEVRLDPGLYFAGIVVDAGGAPVPGVRVIVRGVPDGTTKRVGRSALTGRTGAFRLTGFKQGTYQLIAWRRGFVTARAEDLRSSEGSLRVQLVATRRR